MLPGISAAATLTVLINSEERAKYPRDTVAIQTSPAKACNQGGFLITLPADDEGNQKALHAMYHKRDGSPLGVAAYQIGEGGSQAGCNESRPRAECEGYKANSHITKIEISLRSRDTDNHGKHDDHCSKHSDDGYLQGILVLLYDDSLLKLCKATKALLG